MVTIEWGDREPQLEAEPGERLLDVADERPQTGTIFACRSGHCGTCRVTIIEGRHLLARPHEDESETLTKLGAQPEDRLACQLTIAHDAVEGRVRLGNLAPHATAPAHDS